MSYFTEIKLGSLDASLSVNQNTQLKVTAFDASGNQGVRLLDEQGRSIESEEDLDGGRLLGVSSVQYVHPDPANSTTTNLAVNETWTGTSSSTLGVVGLQFSLKSDQNCYVYFEQSPDGTNWDISDRFKYFHEKSGVAAGDGWTVQALNSYWRVRITNIGSATTTYMRAQGVLCPIAEPLPRRLTGRGRLDVEATIRDWNVHRHQKVSPNYEAITASRFKLVGPSLIGSELDSNFWTLDASYGGNITFPGGRALLSTSTDPSGYVSVETVQKARYVQGTSNEFGAYARFVQNPSVGYHARMGAYDGSNGFFFMIHDASFAVVTRNAAVDTIVWNGDFNGRLGGTLILDPIVLGNYEIEYATGVGDFFVNGDLIHSVVVEADKSMVSSFNFPARAEIENLGNTNNNAIDIRGGAIQRVGQEHTSSVYRYINGAEGVICKRGAGNLHSVINTNNAGSCTLYDGLDDTGKVIGLIDLLKILGDIDFEVDFNDGLYVVTTGAAIVTITYE